MKKFFTKCFYWFGLKIRWNKYWSKLYRFLFQRKYKNTIIEVHNDLSELEKRINKLTYHADSWKELADAIGRPEYVQHCLNQIDAGNLQPGFALDCDDYAVWIAHAFNCTDPWMRPLLLSIAYLRSDKSIGGHMVCLLRRWNVEDFTVNIKYVHASNWGISSEFNSIEECVKNILQGGKQFIGWAIIDHESLSPIEVHLKLEEN